MLDKCKFTFVFCILFRDLWQCFSKNHLFWLLSNMQFLDPALFFSLPHSLSSLSSLSAQCNWLSFSLWLSMRLACCRHRLWHWHWMVASSHCLGRHGCPNCINWRVQLHVKEIERERQRERESGRLFLGIDYNRCLKNCERECGSSLILVEMSSNEQTNKR